MKRIIIGSKVADELYRSGHNAALYFLNERQKGPQHRHFQCRNLSDFPRHREMAPKIKLALSDTGWPDLWADALMLALWTGEDANTTAERVDRIMRQAAQA